MVYIDRSEIGREWAKRNERLAMRGGRAIELPAQVYSSEMPVDVDGKTSEFLRERREYFERARKIIVGEFDFSLS